MTVDTRLNEFKNFLNSEGLLLAEDILAHLYNSPQFCEWYDEGIHDYISYKEIAIPAIEESLGNVAPYANYVKSECPEEWHRSVDFHTVAIKMISDRAVKKVIRNTLANVKG